MFCGWMQWRISNSLDEGRPLSASATKHLLGCARCRDFYKRSLQIEQALAEPSLVQSASTPEALADRFFQAAIHSAPSQAASRFPSRWIALAAAAVFLAAASVLVPLLRNQTQNPGPTLVSNDPVLALQTIVRDLRPIGAAPLPTSATQWQVYLAQPYQKELNLMARDTDSAVKFVASCVGMDLSDRTIVPQMNF
jgi:hypothetical protein